MDGILITGCNDHKDLVVCLENLRQKNNLNEYYVVISDSSENERNLEHPYIKREFVNETIWSENFGIHRGQKVFTTLRKPEHCGTGWSHMDMKNIHFGVKALKNAGCTRMIRIQATTWHKYDGFVDRAFDALDNYDLFSRRWDATQYPTTSFFGASVDFMLSMDIDVRLGLEGHFYFQMLKSGKNNFILAEKPFINESKLNYLRTKFFPPQSDENSSNSRKRKARKDFIENIIENSEIKDYLKYLSLLHSSDISRQIYKLGV